MKVWKSYFFFKILYLQNLTMHCYVTLVYCFQVMEAAFNIQKRPLERELVLERSLICQKVNKGENLRQSTSAGRTAFQDALNKRTKYKCERYSGLIDLLDKNLITLSDESLQLK